MGEQGAFSPRASHVLRKILCARKLVTTRYGHSLHQMPRFDSLLLKRALWLLALLSICGFAFGLRCWNVRDVFVDGHIYFVDADCYSRMTRAAQVEEGRAWLIRHHDFENWPAGITPHTTAPLDWLIVLGKKLFDAGFTMLDRGGTSLLRAQTLDLSGALVSPLLAVVLCAFLGVWARRFAPPGGSLVVALFFAVSPILVHGTVLGRPDHQALLLLFLAIALGAELSLARGLSRRWSVLAGAGWGMALWVSLYEPLVLLAVVAALWVAADRRRFTDRQMRAGWIVFGAIVGGSLLLEGWRVSWPAPEMRAYFANWRGTIGELSHLSPLSPVLTSWLTFAIVPAPVLLYLAGRKDRRAWAVGLLLVAMYLLTVWQVRWGYFLALVFAFCLPWMIAVFARRWIAYLLLVFSLWPLAEDWDERLHPNLEGEKITALQAREKTQLRALAGVIRSEPGAFLAPWWLSPAVAYWSGQPGVAGSSHESLPGTVASARFFASEKPAEAAAILAARRVYWVIADEPARVLANSTALLGATHLPVKPLATVLAEHPRDAPLFLHEHSPQGATREPSFYRLYSVDAANLPQ